MIGWLLLCLVMSLRGSALDVARNTPRRLAGLGSWRFWPASGRPWWAFSSVSRPRGPSSPCLVAICFLLRHEPSRAVALPCCPEPSRARGAGCPCPGRESGPRPCIFAGSQDYIFRVLPVRPAQSPCGPVAAWREAAACPAPFGCRDPIPASAGSRVHPHASRALYCLSCLLSCLCHLLLLGDVSCTSS